MGRDDAIIGVLIAFVIAALFKVFLWSAAPRPEPTPAPPQDERSVIVDPQPKPEPEPPAA